MGKCMGWYFYAVGALSHAIGIKESSQSLIMNQWRIIRTIEEMEGGKRDLWNIAKWEKGRVLLLHSRYCLSICIWETRGNKSGVLPLENEILAPFLFSNCRPSHSGVFRRCYPCALFKDGSFLLEESTGANQIKLLGLPDPISYHLSSLYSKYNRIILLNV